MLEFLVTIGTFKTLGNKRCIAAILEIALFPPFSFVFFIVRSLLVTNLYVTVTGGFRMILTDRSKLVMAVGGVTALAAGVYTTRFL
jgi:Domain of unknown function (DUF3523)